MMRELILKNCNVIHDESLSNVLGSGEHTSLFTEEHSSYFTAKGDIDGDGEDEIIVSNQSRLLAVIKGSQVYRINQQNHYNQSSRYNLCYDDSVCSLHVVSLTGGLRSEIVTVSLTGRCTIYKFDGTLPNAHTTSHNAHSTHNTRDMSNEKDARESEELPRHPTRGSKVMIDIPMNIMTSSDERNDRNDRNGRNGDRNGDRNDRSDKKERNSFSPIPPSIPPSVSLTVTSSQRGLCENATATHIFM